MEKYVFLFAKQRFQYLMQSVAIAIGGVILTALLTLMLYLLIQPQEHSFSRTLAWFLFFIPAGVAHYRPWLCRKMPLLCFFLLLILTISLPLVWVMAKTDVRFIIWSLVTATAYFAFTVYRGLIAQKTLSFYSITSFMFFGVAVVCLLEFVISLNHNQAPSMYWTFGFAALIFGLYNIRDVFQFRQKLLLNTGYEKKDVVNVVNETALCLYLNFLGMVMIIDFMKFVVKLMVETPVKKSVSE